MKYDSTSTEPGTVPTVAGSTRVGAPRTFAGPAATYRAAGWAGTLPLPARAKKSPPSGYTGHAGAWPTDDDVIAWDAAYGDSFNFALRLPADVVGIDVDGYGGKVGAATLSACVTEWGALPATYRSTARADDAVSGIRLFRVPAGLRWPNHAGTDIDVVHAGYRYVVAAPSVHPELGTPYVWTDPHGTAVPIPVYTALPELPDAWIVGLTQGEMASARADVDTDAWLAELPDGEPCNDVADVLDRARLAFAGDGRRYAVMLTATMQLVNRGHGGCPGVAGALLDLSTEYAAAVAGEHRNANEFTRSLHGAIGKVAGAPVYDADRCTAYWQGRMTLLDPPALPSVWEERPILRHLRDFSYARRVSPYAVLGVTLARVTVAAPPCIVLPALVGDFASLNLFTALVGPSGSGKGAAEKAAAAAIDMGDIECANVGSGEGIGHMYAAREKGELVRLRDAVLFSIPEVDSLTALGNRQGATLMPQLRSAWSGERLGFGYADKSKNLTIEPHTYRMGVVLGVQPGRAEPLLDDADGGTPQRFLWMPSTDPDLPRHRSEAPAQWKWSMGWPAPLCLHPMDVCTVAVDAVDEAAYLRSTGQGDKLDGHALLTRLKVAAALALLERRRNVTEDDWRIAGRIMDVSDATRAEVVRFLRDRNRTSNVARGEAEAARAVVVDDAKEARAVKRAAQSVKTALGKRPGEWVSGADLRRSLSSTVRPLALDALDALETSGDIEVEPITDKVAGAVRYRLTS